MTDEAETILMQARAVCNGTGDILTELISRHASNTMAPAGSMTKGNYLQIIKEIATLRARVLQIDGRDIEIELYKGRG